MLSGISKAARIRFALVLVAMYALCILAPSAAVAFNGAPCLPENSGITHIHVHGSDAEHEDVGSHEHSGKASHHDGADDHAATKCCSVAFFSAITPAFALSLAPTIAHAASFEGLSLVFTGLAPDQLIRPPKSLS